jgi:signal transduction histidine kinase/CheY-like chemotaxis protein
MRPQLSITAKLVGYLLVAGIVPLLAFGLSTFRIAREVVMGQVGAYNLRVAADMATYLDLYRTQVEDLAANMASNETIAQAMGEADGMASSAYDTLNTRAQIGYILSNVGRVKGLVSIDLLTLGGKHFYVGETLDVSAVPMGTVRSMVAASEAVGANAWWRGVEDNINTNSTHKKVISLSRVVRRYDPQSGVNSTVGVVLISLSDTIFRDYFQAVALAAGMRMMVVDRNGRLMFHSDPRLMGQMLEPELLRLVRSPEPMKRLTLDGVEVVMTSVTVHPGDSHLMFTAPLAQLTDPVNRIARAGLLLLLVCLVGIGMLALHYSRTVVLPLRAVSDRFRFLRENPGLQHLPLAVASKRDEITTLVEGFNAYIETLTAQRQAEAERKKADRVAMENLYRLQSEALALREVEAKNLQLEEASRMKSEFLATMSHELRTPLNAIIGFSEALKDGLIGDITNTQKEYVGDIFFSGQHLLSLINDILDLSKVEAGMMTLELEAVDVKHLLQNSMTIIKEKAAAQKIQVELDVDDDLGTPWLDLRKTKQIIYNLLSNAVKFTPAGGRMRLSGHRVPRSAVGKLPGTWPMHGFPLAESRYPEFLEIRTSDSGIGITSDDMKRLFQPFMQIDSALSRKYQGTGLGLAMVRQMAELHGGTVAVSSLAGKGSKFAVWVPIRGAGDSGGKAGTGESGAVRPVPSVFGQFDAAPAGPTERVALVVDDDDKAADLIRLLLEAEAMRVVRAKNAEEALVLAPQQALSLIILAIQLPGMNGWDFLEKIRRMPRLGSVPVVIVAAQDYSDMALSRGAAAVLHKPVSRDQLRDLLDELGLNPVAERTHTVLIVDDDPKAVEVIAAFLEGPAYNTVRAYGGRQAIALARQLHPNLILLDLIMPDVSGFDVVVALGGSPETADIPILVVTAKEITEEDRTALSRNGSAVVRTLEKASFDRLRFMAEVRRALSPKAS